MTTLQIALLLIAGSCSIVALIFNLMFVFEISFKQKAKKEEEVESVFSYNVVEEKDDVIDVKTMLAKLDEETIDEENNDIEELERPDYLAEFIESKKVVEDDKKEEQISEELNEEDYDVDEMLAKLDEETEGEVIAEPAEVEESIVEESVSQDEEIIKETETVEETEEIIEAKEETKEEIAEVKEVATNDKTEAKEEKIEDIFEDVDDEEDDEDVDATEDAEILEYTGLKEEPAEYSANGSIDYSSRLEKIITTRDKIERDLAKVQKAILKYERTKRRKNRNQKMLDRRAGELTNLNLVMYSVTDIKNVDEDKKIKQEELTAHIAELKASIQDAEEYIESNKEKNEHNVKMAKFLTQEKLRYNEEIAELQNLINSGDNETK